MDQTSSTSIGQLMKAARKFKRLNQAEVARAMGCSQSALSKMEHNLLVPSAPQWFMFARFTAIPPESLESGIIDRHSRVRLNNDEVSQGYRLPKRYRINRSQKVREVYPLLFYLEKKIDADVFKKFMESVGVGEEFFVDFDNLINFQLTVDLINLYLRLGYADPVSIRKIVEFGQDDLYWDRSPGEWNSFGDRLDLLTKFIQEQAFFQVDLHVHAEFLGESATVSFIPEPHLYHFLKDITPEVTHWLSEYRMATIAWMYRRFLQKVIQVKPLPALSRSPLESRFEVLL